MSDLLIFKINTMVSNEKLLEIKQSLLEQVEKGVVTLPHYISVEECCCKECDIKVVDCNGNVVE